MKRKEKPSFFDTLCHRFPIVRLYRKDLDEIIEIASSRNLEIKITDDDYEYESLDEVQEQQGNRVKKLRLNASLDESLFKSFDVEIDQDGVTVRAHREDELIPFWHQVRDLIAKKVPWYAKFTLPYVWAWVVIGWLWVASNDEAKELPRALLLTWFGVLVLSVAMAIFSFWYRFTNRGVFLQKEHEVLGFWTRNGEKIVMLIIGTMLGVVVKVVADLIIGKWF